MYFLNPVYQLPFEFNQDTVNQYGFLGAFLGAAITVLLYKGIPAFFKYLEKRAEISLKEKETDDQTQQVENKKDLALIRAQQVLEDENTELRQTGRLQAAQIIEQANEISRLKPYEFAVEEVRNQRRLLIEWIITEGYLDKDTLIKQLENDVLILETMVSTEYVEKDKNHE